MRSGLRLAREREEIIHDNQGVVKTTPLKQKGVVKDQDYRGIGYHNAPTKRVTIWWTPGHRTLEQATTYSDYKDTQGNNYPDVLANMQPQPHANAPIRQTMHGRAKV